VTREPHPRLANDRERVHMGTEGRAEGFAAAASGSRNVGGNDRVERVAAG